MMDAKKYTALVTGATGMVGQELVAQLLADDRFEQVIVWGRRPMAIVNPKLVQEMVNFEALPQSIEALGIDFAFCCLGTTIKKAGSKAAQYKIDYEYVVAFAETCKKNRIGSFAVVSSIGATINTRNFYLHTKGEMEAALQNITFRHLLVVRPSLLLGKRNEFRLAERISMKMMKAIGWMLVGNLKKYRGVEAATVAAALIRESVSGKIGTQIVESDQL